MEHENCTLLGYYATSSAGCIITQKKAVLIYFAASMKSRVWNVQFFFNFYVSPCIFHFNNW